MGELFVSIWHWITRKEKSSLAIDGFIGLTASQRDFNEQVIDQLNLQARRLDECEEDRDELRNKIVHLEQKVYECDEDRKDLRERIETLESNTSA